MRDLVLLGGFLFMLPWVFGRPHVGVLLWCWTALVVPNYFVYGIADPVPFNKIAAILTLLVWLFSRQPKRLPSNRTLVLLGVFTLWGTISAFFSISKSDVVMAEWEKFIKVMVFSFVVVGVVTTRLRVELLLYAICLALGLHGVLEGTKFIASGGSHHIRGPGTSIIADNNHFALAMIALLPVMLYLYKHAAKNQLLKIALGGASVIVVFSIMGTFSRGGFLGIAAVGTYAFVHSRRKLRFALIVIPVLIAAVAFAPEKWSARMDTIKTADQDNSFMGRVIAWKQSTLIAMDNPLFGGGFHAVQDRVVWLTYREKFSRLDFIPTDDPDPSFAYAAHSIYFQVLGDMGFAGLAIFISLMVSAWRNANAVIVAARNRPHMNWAHDLAGNLRYSLIAYCVSGAALSMAYFDFLYMVFALLVVLRAIVEKATNQTYAVNRPVPVAAA